MTDDAERAKAVDRLHQRYRDAWDAGEKTIFHRVRVDEARLAAEGDYIRSVIAKADPGTAGDAAESIWGEVLTPLFPEYQVVVKGKITGKTMGMSPQIDILIVESSCPAEIIRAKLIPSALVVAAFECKLTLRLLDLKKSIETARIIKQESRYHDSDPIGCLPIFYGVLALGSAITGKTKLSCNAVLDAIERYEGAMPESLDMLDAVVVPDQFCLSADPEIYCYDVKNCPHDMWLHRRYAIMGDPEHSTPAESPFGLFLYKLFGYLGRSDRRLAKLGQIYKLFVEEFLHTPTFSETPLARLVPFANIDRLAKGGYSEANICFHLYM